MTVIDTSALLAVLLGEDDAAIYVDAILAADDPRVAAASLLEAAIVLESRVGLQAGRRLDALVSRAGIAVEPVTSEHVEIARVAYRRFGRGHHPAALNFGDCMAYALAKATGEPLLYKGNDFSQTDLPSALGAVG